MFIFPQALTSQRSTVPPLRRPNHVHTMHHDDEANGGCNSSAGLITVHRPQLVFILQQLGSYPVGRLPSTALIQPQSHHTVNPKRTNWLRIGCGCRPLKPFVNPNLRQHGHEVDKMKRVGGINSSTIINKINTMVVRMKTINSPEKEYETARNGCGNINNERVKVNGEYATVSLPSTNQVKKWWPNQYKQPFVHSTISRFCIKNMV